MTAKVVAILMFCGSFKRRKLFPLRLVAAIAVIIGMDFIPLNIRELFFVHFLYNTATFLVLSLLIWLCYNEKYFTILFVCVAGKCVMHISEYCCKMIFAYTGKPETYIDLIVYTAVYIAVFFLFAKRLKSDECVGVNNWKTAIFAFSLVIFADLLNMVFMDHMEVDRDVKLIFYCMNVIYCFVMLSLQFGLLSESRVKREAEIMKQLRKKEQEQYEISQETIKLIGIKHHDIKNMVENMKTKFSQEDMDELNKLVDSYDITFKTGNTTLDTVLTEKFIACKKMNIRLESLVNGEALSFMRDADIYSLFLNILNNSIESADKLDEPDKRIIHLEVYTRDKLLFIQTQNYYSEDIQLNSKNEIITSKTDKRYHGFGLQSIKMIAKNYDGAVSIKTENKMFNLSIVVPVP